MGGTVRKVWNLLKGGDYDIVTESAGKQWH
jgi:hypothetical protein